MASGEDKEEEEEVLIEVEAVESVYGDDCMVIQRFPPHLQLHIKPRTADDSSQQFVEAILELRAGSQYPKEPPQIGIIDSKGLDVARKARLVTSLQEKIDELSSCLMLVALCEEAVQMLSQMNHPDGDCPLCLYPLVKEDVHGNLWPFMKLMSCYHCFHSKCIIKWWNWLQQQNETDPTVSSAIASRSRNQRSQRDMEYPMRIRQDMSLMRQMACQLMSASFLGWTHRGYARNTRGTTDPVIKGLPGAVKYEGTCPVCRKVFQATDIEHVLDLVQTYSSQMTLEEPETDDDEELQQSEKENIRRKDFEALLKLQEKNNGLIEPKKNQVLLPGVFLPEPVIPPAASTPTSAEPQQTVPVNTPISETRPSRPSNKPGTSSRSTNNFGMRKNKTRHSRNTRTQNTQWVKKENSSTD